MNEEQKSVREFHKLIGAWTASRPSIPPTSVRNLRKTLLDEELAEYVEASNHCDLVGVADALADLLVVTYGAALAWGIDLEPIFAEVQRTNMLKAGGPIREDGKRLKPEGWQPPDIANVLSEQSVG